MIYSRWTKYSNPGQVIGMTPPSPNVNVKQLCVTRHAGGVISFVHPSQPLKEKNNFEIWGAWGVKKFGGHVG